METTEKPLKFRWILVIASTAWAFMAISYEVGWTQWQDLTFIQTFIGPGVLLVALAPLSTKSVASSKWHMPVMAAWAGVMIPLVYLAGRWITGFEHRGDGLFLIGGIIIGTVILVYWAITVIHGHRKSGVHRLP